MDVRIHAYHSAILAEDTMISQIGSEELYAPQTYDVIKLHGFAYLCANMNSQGSRRKNGVGSHSVSLCRCKEMFDSSANASWLNALHVACRNHTR